MRFTSHSHPGLNGLGDIGTACDYGRRSKASSRCRPVVRSLPDTPAPTRSGARARRRRTAPARLGRRRKQPRDRVTDDDCDSGLWGTMGALNLLQTSSYPVLWASVLSWPEFSPEFPPEIA